MDGMSYNAGNANSRLKYSSKELDEALNYNQYAFGWRDYDPNIGRWHVKDPLYLLHFDLNPYNFVANNPINNVDLFGLTYLWGSDGEFLGYYDDGFENLHATWSDEANTWVIGKPGEQENSDDYDPLGNNPWDNAQGGGITGDDITGGGWPGYGNNLPGKGGSRKRRTGPKKKSKSSTAEKIAGAAGLANGIKSTILETTDLVAKKAGEELGKAFSKYLAALKVVNALGYGIAMYDAAISIKEDINQGRDPDPTEVFDFVVAGAGLLTIPFSGTAAVVVGGFATLYLGGRYLYDLYKGDK